MAQHFRSPLGTLQIRESLYCTEAVIEVRTWRERLLSTDVWPRRPWYARAWSPWRRLRCWDKPTSYMVKGTLFAHPAIVAELKRSFVTEGN